MVSYMHKSLEKKSLLLSGDQSRGIFFLNKKNIQKLKSSVESLFFIRKDILCHLFFEYNFLQMLAATTPQGVHSEGPILAVWR